MDFETDFDGMIYSGSLTQAIDRQIYFLGCYAKSELVLLDLFASTLNSQNKKICFVDIGANVGQHSLFMSRRAEKIYSFEPQREAVEQFKSNVLKNSISNITIFEFALGDIDSKVELGSGFEGNNGSRSLVWSLDKSKNTTVDVFRSGPKLAETVAEKIDILKIDVEGYEKKVFKGMHERIISDRPIIMFELIGKDIKSGFNSLDELSSYLYPQHALFAVDDSSPGKLSSFDWDHHEEAVCIPLEIIDHFVRDIAV